MATRFRSRHLRATMFNKLRADMTALGWVTAPVNFGATGIRFIDYQPDERGEIVNANTVAVSIGDVTDDTDEELGAQIGGLRSAWYPVFVDVYMAEQALSDAVCDDVRAIFDMKQFPMINQVTGLAAPELLEIEEVLGPDRPTATGSETYKRNWRIMRLGVRLYYNTD